MALLLRSLVARQVRCDSQRCIGLSLAFVDFGFAGVVGQMPVVHAGETFEYHSSVQLPSSRGSMVGALQVMEGDVSRSFPPKVTSNVEEDPESLIDALIGKTSLIGPFDYST